MTHRLATNYAKNYCNRTLIVKVIVENVVTCFFGTQCMIVNQHCGSGPTGNRSIQSAVPENPSLQSNTKSIG